MGFDPGFAEMKVEMMLIFLLQNGKTNHENRPRGWF